ncbi:MAG: hypothetical protein KL785_05190 [Brevundimonas sp.]|nr:hypothetical protein [Brevundimonas sp.]MBX9460571.1 hypothetical protein [Brevundimonas sp.]
MQNPFRHQDEPGRSDHERDEGRWEARERRPDEYRTWGGGDGGRTAEAFRREGQSYGRDRSGPAGAWTQDSYQQSQYAQRGPGGWTGEGGGYPGPGDYAAGAQSYGGGPQYGRDFGGPQFDQGYSSRGPTGGHGSRANQAHGGPSYGGQGYGGQSYGSPSHGGQGYGGQSHGGQGQADHGYAPGGQIWQGSGQGMGGQSHEHHDFEPDYLHWRQQQLSAFDKDYSDWRNERREKFSSDFDSWRQSRPRVQAENPIVGDVSDGGTGDASEAKKR